MRMKFQGALINAAAATQMAPKVNRLDCTFTGPKRSANVDLHFVPPVHTQLPNTLGSYISKSVELAGFGLQSVIFSPAFNCPYLQYLFPVFKLVNFKNACRLGFSAGGKS